MRKAVVELTLEEANAMFNLMNEGLKAVGDPVAETYVHLKRILKSSVDKAVMDMNNPAPAKDTDA